LEASEQIFLGFDIGNDYLSVASKWLHKEKFYNTNVISSTVLRSIWLVRNNMVFNKNVWSYVKYFLRMALRILME
jgi:hypothetical protein